MTAQTQQLKKQTNRETVASQSSVNEGVKQVVKLNYLRMAPRKVGMVAALIRGLSTNNAEAQLMFQPRRAAKPLLKLLRSAIASAKAKGKLDMNKLFIESIRVDKGPMLKRYMPRAQGSMSEIQKKMSHVTLILAENPKVNNSKFTIVVPKKVKHLEHEENSKKPQKKEKEMDRAPKQKQPGLFKKFFDRKAGNRGTPNKIGV